MYSTLSGLIDRLDSSTIYGSGVIRWGAPVLSFGDLSISKVATLGLNPSNREFVDESGKELQGALRRFHTLGSLGLDSWAEADVRHLDIILESCRTYFRGNPYDRWFRKLDKVVTGAEASFYDSRHTACHLDLIPYATVRKWGELSGRQRSRLMALVGDSLGMLLSESPVNILILNGKSVVQYFQDVASVTLDTEVMPGWTLPRSTKGGVTGVAYRGVVNALCGVSLRQEVLVLGYNHNIQSSFGVTTEVINAIRKWIAQMSRGICR